MEREELKALITALKTRYELATANQNQVVALNVNTLSDVFGLNSPQYVNQGDYQCKLIS